MSLQHKIWLGFGILLMVLGLFSTQLEKRSAGHREEQGTLKPLTASQAPAESAGNLDYFQ